MWGAFAANYETVGPWVLAAPSFFFGVFKNAAPLWTAELFYESYRGGKPRALTENLEEMILDELETFEKQEGKDLMAEKFTSWRGPLTNKYRFKVADDLRGVTFGNPRFIFAFSCCVGLPSNIFYDSIDDVAADCDNLKITAVSPMSWWRGLLGERGQLQKVKWGSETGVRLMENLVLSPDAKRFLVQRLIQQVDTMNTPAVDALAFSFPIVAAGFVNHAIKKFFSRRHRGQMRKPLLWPLYACTVATGFFLGDLVRRLCYGYIDLKADQVTASIGSSYLNGGIEFYEKMLKRNRCINDLLQQDGLPTVYSAEGDYIPRRLRKSATSIKLRLGHLLKMKEEVDENV